MLQQQPPRIESMYYVFLEGIFLEGTGSIVFDHEYRKAYASLSSRTSNALLKKVCQSLSYEPVIFDAVDEMGKPIYHTNVMMWM